MIPVSLTFGDRDICDTGEGTNSQGPVQFEAGGRIVSNQVGYFNSSDGRKEWELNGIN